SAVPLRTAEVTAEPTKLRPREIEVDVDASTVHTEAAADVSVVGVPDVLPRRKSIVPIGVSLAIVLTIVIGAATMLRNHPQPPAPKPVAPRRIEAAVVAMP